MKKIRLMSVILVLVMACSLLTGCVGEIADIKINADGTGTIDMQFGFTETALETMVSMGTDASEIEHYKPFEYNGKTYYGERIIKEFKSVDEFNTIINGDVQSEIDESLPTEIEVGYFNLSQTEEGRFVFSMNAVVENDVENSAVTEDTFTEEEWGIILEDMAIIFNVRFPSNVVQTKGSTEGVTVKGCTLSLNLIEIGESLKENVEYEFMTYLPKEIAFMDVKESHWGRNAIYSLAYGDLVKGVSDGKFNPEGTLTRAEFYTILARAAGLSVKNEDSDFWAYNTVKASIINGFVIDMLDEIGNEDVEINIEDWNVPILREEAVSAIVLATDRLNFELKKNSQILTINDIPDNIEIKDIYKDYVVEGFNIGVTGGVDEKHTFKPLNTLTRVQICQMLYNLDWCQPVENNG